VKSQSLAPPFGQWERSVASRYLRTRRQHGGVALISIISFVGILLAVATLIIVMSVMNGFRTELLSRILGFNGHMFITGEVLAEPGPRALAVSAVRQVPGVLQAQPLIEAQAMVIGNGQISGAIVRGVVSADLAASDIISHNLKSGSLNGFGVGEYGGDQIIMGQRLADLLGLRAGDLVSLVSPVGASTVMGSAPTQKDYVVGATFSVGMSEYDQSFIYMPLEQAQLFFGREQAVDVIELKVDDPDRAERLKSRVRDAAGPGALVTDWTQKNKSYFTALQVERSTMRLILMLLVAIAAMNIISGLVMLVKNKGRDIAILRTMGATRSSILRIFVMVGASIGVLGTLAGLLLGVVFCLNIGAIQTAVEWITRTQVFNSDVYYLSRVPARVEWSEVGIIALWAFLMSFLATLPPAWRASRLDPVEALRYE